MRICTRASANASIGTSSKRRLETEEIRDIYKRKGFNGELLNRIVQTITANEDVWVAVMMAEEHQLSPVDRRTAMRAAWVVGLSAIVGSLVPIAPFMFLPVSTSMWVSVLVTALVLFAIGAYKARVTVGKPMRSGMEMMLIGTISALAGYLVGVLLKIRPFRDGLLKYRFASIPRKKTNAIAMMTSAPQPMTGMKKRISSAASFKMVESP